MMETMVLLQRRWWASGASASSTVTSCSPWTSWCAPPASSTSVPSASTGVVCSCFNSQSSFCLRLAFPPNYFSPRFLFSMRSWLIMNYFTAVLIQKEITTTTVNRYVISLLCTLPQLRFDWCRLCFCVHTRPLKSITQPSLSEVVAAPHTDGTIAFPYASVLVDHSLTWNLLHAPEQRWPDAHRTGNLQLCPNSCDNMTDWGCASLNCCNLVQ